MEANKNHITEMQKLAEAGWKQMHETLLEHGLSSDETTFAVSSGKRNFSFLIAACIFFFLIFTYPFILNDSSYFSYHQNADSQNSLLKKAITETTPADRSSFEDNELPVLTSQQKHLIHQKMNADFLQLQKENFARFFKNEKEYLLQKLSNKQASPIEIPADYHPVDTAIKIEKTLPLQREPGNSFSKKIKFFTGIGVNVPAGNKYAHSFDVKDFNIHPAVTVIIPLTQKLNLHAGLSAFSTIHGKEVSAEEKELVNNINSNVYYSINTTSIIKASYFDLPITLHYSINKNWSVGSGIQLSKLYKVSIKEEKESFDYNNTLYSASVSQYTATPMAARAAFQKKVEIKKIEPRFVAEANLLQGHFLFSAGYYYSLEKSIILNDSYNTSRQYRNEYFKLGIQYRISGK